jgi:SAM-dependent methyltransferase
MSARERARPVRRAESFDEVADLYAAARPEYPEELLTDLVAFTGLLPTHRILEIGAGTGQLTVSLAKRHLQLVAIERGPRLASLLERNLAQFPRASVVLGDFDEWEAPVGQFDVVVAATAFHWLSSATRVPRCARLLRSGGALAIVATYWGAGERDDRFARESQGCYAHWDPGHRTDFRHEHPDNLPLRNDELEDSGLFSEIAHRRYFCRREYSADAYCDLLGTFSDVLAFGEDNRKGFLGCVLDLIQQKFDGHVSRTDVHDLWVAGTRG